MKSLSLKKSLLLNSVAFFSAVVLYPIVIRYSSIHVLAIVCIMISFMFPFLIILESNKDRLEKGIMLLFLGITLQYWFFHNDLKIMSIPHDVLFPANILSDLITYACSGAGGGLIATHSDVFSKENLIEPIKISPDDNSIALKNSLKDIDLQLKLIQRKNLQLQFVIIFLLIGLLAKSII